MGFGILKLLKRKQYRLGLALSGGGTRGISHLGAIKAIRERGYEIDIISGTSMGALIGCLIADGYEPDEILEMLTPSQVKGFIKRDISFQNFLKLDGTRTFLHETLRADKIENLKIPFIVAATNFNKGEIHYFREGDIIEAVIASASIPLIFPPVIINGERFVDGGVLANLPARPLRPLCEKVIGLHVNPSKLGLKDDDVKNMIQIAKRSFYLGIRANVLEDQKNCDIFIEHTDLYGFKALSFDRLKDIFDIGYKNTHRTFYEIEKEKSAK
ncbi:MAG: patatin-like phospholipase family protein [Candidatus Azobacteroides sp.]|nr:patatin-like phospholipase family protein [Candidatus Azobacteroides sp.]